MKTRHYSNCYLLDDKIRIEKLRDLFNISVKKDINKWSQFINVRKGYNNSTIDLIIYKSPSYGNVTFLVEYAFNDKDLEYGMCYIEDLNNKNYINQIFEDWNSFSSPSKKTKESIDLLRTTIFDENIQKLEDALSQKGGRREKIEQLNIEAYKSIIEDSYKDFLECQTDGFAREIARTAYGFNKNHNLPYSEWIENNYEHSR